MDDLDGDARRVAGGGDRRRRGRAGGVDLMRMVVSQLYGPSAHDSSTLALATGGLALVAGVAAHLAGLRASRPDPMVALRYE